MNFVEFKTLVDNTDTILADISFYPQLLTIVEEYKLDFYLNYYPATAKYQSRINVSFYKDFFCMYEILATITDQNTYMKIVTDALYKVLLKLNP